jgi:hypothetical protein
MCHKLGRERDGILDVEAPGDVEVRRDSSISTRLIPPRAESLGSSGVILVFDAIFRGVVFFFVNSGSFSGFAGFRATVVGPRTVSASALNLRDVIRTRVTVPNTKGWFSTYLGYRLKLANCVGSILVHLSLLS